MPEVITCTSQGDDLSGRRRRGVNRPDDAPAGQRKGASPVPGLARTRPLVATGNPCASRMIPLESPVPYVANSIMWRTRRNLPSELETAAKFAT